MPFANTTRSWSLRLTTTKVRHENVSLQIISDLSTKHYHTADDLFPSLVSSGPHIVRKPTYNAQKIAANFNISTVLAGNAFSF